MLLKNLTIFCVIYLAVATNPVTAEIKFGSWELAVQSQMSGMPITTPRQKTTECFTQDSLIPQTALVEGDCTYTDIQQNRNIVTWKIACKTEDVTMRGGGRIKFRGTKLRGKAYLKPDRGANRNIMMHYSYNGRYQGECEDN